MNKVYLVWERECFDNYDVIYITETREKAIGFVEKLTGKSCDEYEEVIAYYREDCTYTSMDVYIEERIFNSHDPLSV